MQQPEDSKWQHTMIGRYLLLRLAGRGNFGEVWYAEDTQMHREVAVKLLPPTPVNERSALQDFEREARIVAGLEHPHILPIHDFGQQQSSREEFITYIVTPYISGGSLRERLRQLDGPMPPEQALAFLRQAAEAIDFAHSKQTLHRDIKPGNMLLQGDWLFLADFGLSKLLTSTTQRSRTNSGNGTPEFMAPEQAHGKAEFASDVYSLAITAYQLLTGRLPFRGDTPINTLMQQISAPPPPPRSINPALPPGLERALLQGLAKSPQERPGSCIAFVTALEVGLHMGDAGLADPEATTLAPWSRRKADDLPTMLASSGSSTVSAAPQPISSISSGLPTPFSLPSPFPSGAPAALRPEAATGDNNEAYMPTYVTRDPVTPPPREVQPPEGRPRPERKVSRRTLLLGGGVAALVVAGGAAAAYALLHGQTKPVVVQPRPTPTPVPGPKKLGAGVPLLSLTGHSKETNAARWDPTGRYLATGGEDARVLLWDIGGLLPKNAKTIQTLPTPLQSWRVPSAVFSDGLSWSNDGHTLAVVTGDSKIHLIDALKQGSTPQTYQDAVFAHSTNPPAYSYIDWSPDASSFAIPSYVQGQTQQRVDIWQLNHTNGPVRTLTSDASGTARTQIIDYIHPFNQTMILNGVKWSRDGSQLAAHTNFGTVTIWQAATGKIVQTLQLPKRKTKDNPLFVLNEYLAWSPVDPNVLAVSDIEVITIWGIQKNVLLHTLKPLYPFQFMTGLAWAPNGKYMAGIHAQSGWVHIWDVPATATQDEQKARLYFPKGKPIQLATLTDVAWSPNGRYIATASGDTTVLVWQVDA